MSKETASASKIVFLFSLGMLLALTAVVTLWSFTKCHYSFSIGAHCHSASDVPHIHPFADH